MTPPLHPILPDDHYTTLLSYLHPSPSTALELDILPSISPPQILHDPPALALPKSLLVACYISARNIFLSYTTVPQNKSTTEEEKALKATRVIQLYDPTHISAANFRKRWLLRFSERDGDEVGKEEGKKAVREELCWLESLLTSPLPKHAKAETLWAQRGWVVWRFFDTVVDEDALGAGGGERGNGCRMGRLWERELRIVMKAGETHPRNYHAWEYARRLFGSLFLGRYGAILGLRGRKICWEESVKKVHKWCLMHPRDVSGWTFLVFLLRKVLEDENKDWVDVKKSAEVVRVLWETREFVRKYDWKGESVEWFLKAVDILGLEQ